MVPYKVASRSTYDDNRQFVREHVVVAEKMLKRKLNNGEVVHHKDHNKLNNAPSNLIVFASVADHSAFHKGANIYKDGDVWRANYDTKTYKCKYCGKMFSSKYKRTNKSIYCSQKCYYESLLRFTAKDKEELFNIIIRFNGNLCEVGRYYGISDNCVRKHCKKLGLPYHAKYYRDLIRNPSCSVSSMEEQSAVNR